MFQFVFTNAWDSTLLATDSDGSYSCMNIQSSEYN